MSKATIIFHSAVQDVQDHGLPNAGENHLVSRVFFSVIQDGKQFEGQVLVHQPFGSNYSVEPIEVHRPLNLPFNLDHHEFSDAVESYYRKLVGESARMIRIPPGSTLRMRNNTFSLTDRAEVTVVEAGGGGW